MEYWKSGILEGWFLKGYYNFIVNTNFTINPILHYPRTHYSIIPAFHHSNWGEAPNLIVARRL
jgi:hypothetical protein